MKEKEEHLSEEAYKIHNLTVNSMAMDYFCKEERRKRNADEEKERQ